MQLQHRQLIFNITQKGALTAVFINIKTCWNYSDKHYGRKMGGQSSAKRSTVFITRVEE